MTSNIGSPYLLDGIDEDGNIKKEAEALVMGDLRNHFRPEFLNRLDEVILFKPLTKENMKGILDLQLEDLANRLKDREVKLNVTEEAKERIIENGYEAEFGARPLKRYIQKHVETAVAKVLLSGEIHAGDTVLVDWKGEHLEAEIVPQSR